MNRRAVVNVSTGHYVKGAERLYSNLMASKEATPYFYKNRLPEGSPTHQDVPYAFKAYALKEAEKAGYTTLLWTDACILPIKPLGPLFERIERDGYWISNNGWTNYEWTADSAYPELFDPHLFHPWAEHPMALENSRNINRTIPHVVATTFGISLAHPLGKAFLDEYYRLASETKAFCGPWINANYQAKPGDMRPLMGERCQPCGPADVRGHRHDQTAASVIAWRLGFRLTNAPDIFAYRGGETDKTSLVADGAY
jgi:hypothetical protein